MREEIIAAMVRDGFSAGLGALLAQIAAASAPPGRPAEWTAAWLAAEGIVRPHAFIESGQL